MKLIDKKGKLLGKINLIDFVVVVLILFLCIAVLYKFLGPEISTSDNAKGEVTASIRCTFRPESVAKSVQIGQRLVYGTDYIDGEITDVSYTPSDYITTDSQGNVHLMKHPYLKDLYITIKARVNSNSAILKVGTQELCQGKKFTVKTHTLELEGSVETITLNK
jgi:hypothetical protein